MDGDKLSLRYSTKGRPKDEHRKDIEENSLANSPQVKYKVTFKVKAT